MTPAQWRTIRRLFEGALELPAGERAAWVQSEAEGDEELRGNVLRMLEQEGASQGLLDTPVYHAASRRPWDWPQFTAGEVLAGRFRVERLIAQGGMGEVYAATDLELDAPVAVKTIQPGLLGDAAATARFRREVQMARAVSQRNVCRLFDLGKHQTPAGEVLFLSMELVEGPTLKEHLANHGPLTMEEALPIVRQVGAALDAAHESGVVHRDLKPGNVILAPGGRVVVTDFGLARSMKLELTATVTVAGTPAYMAPEQFEGGTVTPAADVYAFGSMLYEMATGRQPFAGDNPVAIALHKVRDRLARVEAAPASASPAWSDVILSCLEYQPEKRPASARTVVEQLETAAGSGRRWRIRISRRQWLAAGGGTAAAAMAFAWRRWGRARPSASARLTYGQAITAARTGLPLEAARLLEKTLQQSPGWAAARARLAEAWLDLDQHRRAREVLAAQAGLFAADRVEWTHLDAVQLTVQGKFQEALMLYGKIADKHDLAQACERMGEPNQAAAVWEELLKAAPGDPFAGLRLAPLLLRSDPARAHALTERAWKAFEAAGNQAGVVEALYQGVRITVLRGEPASMRAEAVELADVESRRNKLPEQVIRISLLKAAALLGSVPVDETESAIRNAVLTAEQSQAGWLAGMGLLNLAQYCFDNRMWLETDRYLNRADPYSQTSAQTRVRIGLLRARLKAVEKDSPSVSRLLEWAREELKRAPNPSLAAEVGRREKELLPN